EGNAFGSRLIQAGPSQDEVANSATMLFENKDVVLVRADVDLRRESSKVVQDGEPINRRISLILEIHRYLLAQVHHLLSHNGRPSRTRTADPMPGMTLSNLSAEGDMTA